tara:strand:- start:633 stop:908 length:276 start_codon:yes stop_codon:yes gene_type:complete
LHCASATAGPIGNTTVAIALLKHILNVIATAWFLTIRPAGIRQSIAVKLTAVTGLLTFHNGIATIPKLTDPATFAFTTNAVVGTKIISIAR